MTRSDIAGRCDGAWDLIICAVAGGAAVAGVWAAPRRPAGVSEAAAGRAAMDAAHPANATDTTRRRQRRALIS
jgi:hypothetical protein